MNMPMPNLSPETKAQIQDMRAKIFKAITGQEMDDDVQDPLQFVALPLDIVMNELAFAMSMFAAMHPDLQSRPALVGRFERLMTGIVLQAEGFRRSGIPQAQATAVGRG